jgi:hypothetical protein
MTRTCASAEETLAGPIAGAGSLIQ